MDKDILMNNKANMIALIAFFSVSSVYASPEIIITPMVGYTGGGSVEDQDGKTYDMKASENYTLPLKHHLIKVVSAFSILTRALSSKRST